MRRDRHANRDFALGLIVICAAVFGVSYSLFVRLFN